MHRGHVAALFVCFLLVSIGPTVGAPSDSAFAQEGIDPDDILLSITVEESGDAVWTIEYRSRLETDEDEQAFEDLRSDIEADPGPYAQRFQDRMDGTARGAENATGREMAITEMTVTAERRDVPQSYGVLTYRFRWSNFAAIEGDRLLVGDAIAGLFLEEETSLLLSWPDGYELAGASPAPDETRDGSVVYNGPVDFGADEPRVELGPAGGSTADDGVRSNPSMLVGAIVAAVLGGAGVFLAYRRREGTVATEDAKSGNETVDAEPAAKPDAELLSNEEQVLNLIEREGGRMKQKAVAERLGWTDAKTSQVTKKLRESGKLEGFRLGRENVLSLPEEDPRSE